MTALANSVVFPNQVGVVSSDSCINMTSPSSSSIASSETTSLCSAFQPRSDDSQQQQSSSSAIVTKGATVGCENMLAATFLIKNDLDSQSNSSNQQYQSISQSSHSVSQSSQDPTPPFIDSTDSNSPPSSIFAGRFSGSLSIMGKAPPPHLTEILNVLNQQGRPTNIHELVEFLQQIQQTSQNTQKSATMVMEQQVSSGWKGSDFSASNQKKAIVSESEGYYDGQQLPSSPSVATAPTRPPEVKREPVLNYHHSSPISTSASTPPQLNPIRSDLLFAPSFSSSPSSTAVDSSLSQIQNSNIPSSSCVSSSGSHKETMQKCGLSDSDIGDRAVKPDSMSSPLSCIDKVSNPSNISAVLSATFDSGRSPTNSASSYLASNLSAASASSASSSNAAVAVAAKLFSTTVSQSFNSSFPGSNIASSLSEVAEQSVSDSIVNVFTKLLPSQQDILLRRLNSQQLLDLLRGISRSNNTRALSSLTTTASSPLSSGNSSDPTTDPLMLALALAQHPNSSESVRRALLEKAFSTSRERMLNQPLNSSPTGLFATLVELQQQSSNRNRNSTTPLSDSNNHQSLLSPSYNPRTPTNQACTNTPTDLKSLLASLLDGPPPTDPLRPVRRQVPAWDHSTVIKPAMVYSCSSNVSNNSHTTHQRLLNCGSGSNDVSATNKDGNIQSTGSSHATAKSSSNNSNSTNNIQSQLLSAALNGINLNASTTPINHNLLATVSSNTDDRLSSLLGTLGRMASATPTQSLAGLSSNDASSLLSALLNTASANAATRSPHTYGPSSSSSSGLQGLFPQSLKGLSSTSSVPSAPTSFTLSTPSPSSNDNCNSGTTGDAVLNFLSTLLLGDQRQQAAPPPLSEPHVALAASLADMSVSLTQAGGTKATLDMAELTRSLREDGRYMFDAQMRTHVVRDTNNKDLKTGAGRVNNNTGRIGSSLRRGTTEYSCSYPGVSWNTRMQSWLVYFEDAKGRKSRTFNPKRLSLGQLELLPPEIRMRYEAEPVEVAMHCACVYAARVRWEGRVRKSLGFQGSRSQSRMSRDICSRPISSGLTTAVPKTEPLPLQPPNPTLHHLPILTSDVQSTASQLLTSNGIEERVGNSAMDIDSGFSRLSGESALLESLSKQVSSSPSLAYKPLETNASSSVLNKPSRLSAQQSCSIENSFQQQAMRRIEAVIQRAATEAGYPPEDQMLTSSTSQFLPPSTLQALTNLLSKQNYGNTTPLTFGVLGHNSISAVAQGTPPKSVVSPCPSTSTSIESPTSFVKNTRPVDLSSGVPLGRESRDNAERNPIKREYDQDTQDTIQQLIAAGLQGEAAVPSAVQKSDVPIRGRTKRTRMSDDDYDDDEPPTSKQATMTETSVGEHPTPNRTRRNNYRRNSGNRFLSNETIKWRDDLPTVQFSDPSQSDDGSQQAPRNGGDESSESTFEEESHDDIEDDPDYAPKLRKSRRRTTLTGVGVNPSLTRSKRSFRPTALGNNCGGDRSKDFSSVEEWKPMVSVQNTLASNRMPTRSSGTGKTSTQGLETSLPLSPTISPFVRKEAHNENHSNTNQENSSDAQLISLLSGEI